MNNTNERLLCRAKTVNYGIWKTGHYMEYRKTPYLRCVIGDTVDVEYRINPDTLCQCTGLRDKHGALIFEGDIVKVDLKLAKTIFRYGCWMAKSLDGKFLRDGKSEMIGDIDRNIIEIAGNIFDNPELLEVESQ